MLSSKTLWKGEFLSVISPEEYPYESVHEDDVIMVFPVFKINSKYYLAIRKEVCPPYLIKDDTLEAYYYTPITGKMDKSGESPEETMQREVAEEAGVQLIDYTIIKYIKNIPVCKTTDMRANLFFIMVDSFKKVDATGDGTPTEEMSKTIFVELNEVENIMSKPNIDFLLIGGYSVLKDVLEDYIQ